MAEALLRHLAPDRFVAASAGAFPVGYVHPLAVAAMERLKVPMEGHRSKSWDEFAGAEFDLVITLCDAAVREPCPAFGGAAVRVHWSTQDPVGVMGGDAERLEFAYHTAEQLKNKIERLVGVDFEGLSADELRQSVQEIGGTA